MFSQAGTGEGWGWERELSILLSHFNKLPVLILRANPDPPAPTSTQLSSKSLQIKSLTICLHGIYPMCLQKPSL